MKRVFDFIISLLLLLVFSPFLFIVALVIFFQDCHSPFYLGERVGINGKLFRMVKLRSMRINADTSKVDSTSTGDSRITPIGHLIRRFKLDELMQLWNVLVGDMSMVGPRPNVPREVSIYTQDELCLIRVRPGITDLASIVFADEGDILSSHENPDLTYNQLIRPWKSRLGLLGIQYQSFTMDLQILMYTALGLVSRDSALDRLSKLVKTLGASPELCSVASRRGALVPAPPPGASQVVSNRDRPPI